MKGLIDQDGRWNSSVDAEVPYANDNSCSGEKGFEPSSSLQWMKRSTQELAVERNQDKKVA